MRRRPGAEAVLERGYAIVAAADGTIVVDARQVAAGDVVALRLARGSASSSCSEARWSAGVQ